MVDVLHFCFYTPLKLIGLCTPAPVYSLSSVSEYNLIRFKLFRTKRNSEKQPGNRNLDKAFDLTYEIIFHLSPDSDLMQKM